MDAGCAADESANLADGEAVWSCRPDAGVKLVRRNFHRRGWQESPVTRESAEETVKTIARGMPGVSGVTVVTCLRAFYFCTQGCGRVERPAFPAPSDRGGWTLQQTRAHRAARSRRCV